MRSALLHERNAAAELIELSACLLGRFVAVLRDDEEIFGLHIGEPRLARCQGNRIPRQPAAIIAHGNEEELAVCALVPNGKRLGGIDGGRLQDVVMHIVGRVEPSLLGR